MLAGRTRAWRFPYKTQVWASRLKIKHVSSTHFSRVTGAWPSLKKAPAWGSHCHAGSSNSMEAASGWRVRLERAVRSASPCLFSSLPGRMRRTRISSAPMADKLILIVEDNDKNLELVRDILQLRGFRTLPALNGH